LRSPNAWRLSGEWEYSLFGGSVREVLQKLLRPMVMVCG
jgi:hypothetical protein